LVDDGSTDDTAAIAERWAVKLPLVIVSKPVNEGVGAARRDGIARCSGDLVALLDADDYLLPDHLEVLLASREGPQRIVTPSGYRWVPERGLARLPYNLLTPLPELCDQPREILRRNFLYSAVLFDRESYLAAGGFRSWRCDEDWDLWIRMIRNGCRVTAPETVTMIIRNRADSLSSGEKALPWDIALLEELLDQVTPGERPIVKQALRRRQARMRLFDGYQHARAGRRSPARIAWLKAALQDRSLQGGLAPQGSITLRALLCMLAPQRVVENRDRRVVRDVRLE
jgi:glycosyltransferase involved in cell wall biosynthesis